MQRCQSGRSCSLGTAVYRNVPRVQIPVSAPYRTLRCSFFAEWDFADSRLPTIWLLKPCLVVGTPSLRATRQLTLRLMQSFEPWRSTTECKHSLANLLLCHCTKSLNSNANLDNVEPENATIYLTFNIVKKENPKLNSLFYLNYYLIFNISSYETFNIPFNKIISSGYKCLCPTSIFATALRVISHPFSCNFVAT